MLPGNSNASGAGSNKNSVLNKVSKVKPPAATGSPYIAGGGVPPVLDPATYGGYAATVMGLQQHLAGAMALSKAGIGAAQALKMTSMEAARQTQIGETVGAESSALQAGTVGSSGDLMNRAQAVTDAAGQKQAALATAASSIAGYRSQNIGAIGDFYTGLGNAQTSIANAQAQLAADNYRNDLLQVQNQNFDALRAQVLARLKRNRTRDLQPVVPTAPPSSYGENPYSGGVTPPNPLTGNPGYGRQGGTGYIRGGRT